MNYKILHDELIDDPLGRGYSAMSDLEAADDLNTEYRTRTLERLDPSTVYNSVDVSEFLALTNIQRQEVWDIVHVGSSLEGGLWVRPGDLARTRFVALFGGASDTIAALAALLSVNISRAEELGLGIVYGPYVNEARAMVTI